MKEITWLIKTEEQLAPQVQENKQSYDPDKAYVVAWPVCLIEGHCLVFNKIKGCVNIKMKGLRILINATAREKQVSVDNSLKDEGSS